MSKVRIFSSDPAALGHEFSSTYSLEGTFKQAWPMFSNPEYGRFDRFEVIDRLRVRSCETGRGRRSKAGEMMRLFALALCAGLVAGCSTRIRVTDGDTIRLGDERIRIENLDAPEVGERARCEYEARMGDAATVALEALLQSGEVTITRNTKRPKDRYGRTLAVVLVDGKDVAPRMIYLGVARPWTGRSSNWCSSR